jgi:nuclear GTP-binding protein
VASWLAYLRSQHPTLLFCASSAFLPATAEPAIKSKGKEKALICDAIGANAILAYLSERAQEKDKDEPLAVAVVGLTNVRMSLLSLFLINRRLIVCSGRPAKAHLSIPCLEKQFSLSTPFRPLLLLQPPPASLKK